MKSHIFFTSALLLLVVIAFGQLPITDSLAKAEMSKLSFLTGQWEGDGWMIGQDRQKHSFTQTEDIRFKLDSTAILIEGLGMSENIITHNALAIIRYNASNNDYWFYSYLSNGREGKFKAKLLEDTLYWFPAEHIRYIISIDGNGHWNETGEMKRNNSWMQFFEMTLQKK